MNRSSSNDSSTADDETDDEEASISSSISSHSASEEEDLPQCPAARLLVCNNVQQERYSNSQQSHLTNSQQMANSRREKRSKNALFMEEKLIEEREAEEREEMESRRVTSAMKVREDTLDGAEEPDTDPPQRRKTIEDISIEELSALRTNLPPEYPEDDAPPTLLPCLTCNRTFNPKALDRHRKVCQKLSETNKKKQVFNAITQKFEGLDSSSGPNSARATTPERKNSASKKPSRWREKHKEFLRTIRAARGTPEGDADAGPNIPSDYIQCPHCERHFGPKAAERHIDWCKEQSTRLRRGSADTQLVERLRSRTKYVPPKPGQSGWRAPKKTDVISSIPPPSSGPTPDMRKISPPHLGLPHHPRRGVSPAGQRTSASLGRQSARSFTSLLQAVSNNYQSPYGQRMSTSGYATPSSYSAYGGQMGGSRTPNLSRSGSFSGTSPGGSFSRSASLRIPNSRRNSSKMARRRDLASDMLASVMQGMSPARGEPEGNEAEDFSSRETTLSPPPYKSYNDLKYDSSYDSKFDSPSLYTPSKFEIPKFDVSSKFDDLFDTKYEDPVVEVSYDPYSAAEMQMQALLGSPMKKGSNCNEGLGAAGLGTGQDSSPPLGGGKFVRRTTPPSPKPRPTKFDSSLSPALSRRAQSPYYSDSLSASPSREKRSPWRLSPSPPPRDRWPAHSPNQAWSPNRGSPTRESTYGRSSTSPSTNYTSYNKNGTPDTNKRENRFSVSSTGGRRESNTSEMYDNQYNSTSEKDSRLFKRSSLSGRLSSGSADDNNARSFSFGRTLSSESNNNRSTLESKPTLRGTKSNSSTLSSLKTLRSAIQGNSAEQKLQNSYSDAKVTRCSSSSSESSLPPLSSPSISPSYTKLRPKKDFTSPEVISTPRLNIKKSSVDNSNEDSLDQIISSLTNMGMESESAKTAKFCHDCGQKYPSEAAKFCCHCGSRRSS